MGFALLRLGYLIFVSLVILVPLQPQRIVAESARKDRSALITSRASLALAQVGREDRLAQSVYLPLIAGPDQFAALPALWAREGASPPPALEVALFRCTFELAVPLTATSVDIFADTRYELWLNGHWLARGPARFSLVRREYDHLELGTLDAGRHVVAILAQWAPNTRRSESVQPQMQARLSGLSGTTWRSFAFDPTYCQAISSSAWRPDAIPIHRHGLLGSAEILDLRRLPNAWQQPTFDATHWPAAEQRIVLTNAPYRPRTIPQSEQVPIPVRLHDAGDLTPDFWLGELEPQIGLRYQFTLATTTLVRFQTLAAPSQPALAAVTLNSLPLTWEPVANAVPDLRQATYQLPSGTHQLALTDPSAFPEGWLFAISHAGITSAPPPFGNGRNPGLRLLLPAFQSDPTLAVLTPHPTGNGLDLHLARGPAYVVLDLGRTVHGRLFAEVEGRAGDQVDLGWDERLWQQQRPLPAPGSLHPEWSQADRWVLDDQPRYVSTLDARTGRYLLLAYWGAGPLHVRGLQVLEERLPLTLQGSFVSEEPRLNQIWAVGVTTLYPTMVDAYADPWRERGQWWGDAHIADRINQVSFGEVGLLRRGLRLVADSAQATDGIPSAFAPTGGQIILFDYAMLWVQSLHDYVRLTDDLRLLDELAPTLNRFMTVLGSYEHPTTGLLEIKRPDLPWGGVYIDSSSFWDRRGQSTALNSFYYQTLRHAADLARVRGDQTTAERWDRRADHVRTQVNQLLYLPEQGRYAAGLVNGVLSAPTPQSQAAALAFGLPPEAEQPRIVAALLDLIGPPERPRIQILGMYNLLQGLGRAGQVDAGIDVIERYFGPLIERGATTWWEHFQADTSYTASLSHAWGGSPTWFLTTYGLGLTRTGPQAWQLTYHPSRLRQLQGALPLADGVVTAAWQVRPCVAIQLHVEAPSASTGIVRMPGPEQTTELWLDGVQIWQPGQPLTDPRVRLEADGFRFELGAGRYQIEARRSCRVFEA